MDDQGDVTETNFHSLHGTRFASETFASTPSMVASSVTMDGTTSFDAFEI
jgi:hypothetical protein